MTSKTTAEWIETIISPSIKEIAQRCIRPERRHSHYLSLRKAILWGTDWGGDGECRLSDFHEGLMQAEVENGDLS